MTAAWLGHARPAAAQTRTLQTTVNTSLSCAPSQNGTGHMICGEELRPSGTTFGGVSWQAQPTNGTPQEPAFTVDTSTTALASGPYTGTPGCSQTADGSGNVVCAVQGPNNGLYGISIHPQPPQKTSALIPLILPGTVLTSGINPTSSPCTPSAPCNIVGGVAGAPSCSSAGGGEVICAAVMSMQNTRGAARLTLVGVAFDPNQALAAGTNPAITQLPYTPTYASNPSCVTVTDATKSQNNGQTFAACGVAVMNNAPWATATIFGTAFDPRTGYSRGGLIISSPTDFIGDPSCAAPRDGSTEVMCAIGTGDGQAFGSGTFTTLDGFGFDPVNRTTTPIRNLGTAPSGFWTGVGCASPNVPGAQTTVLCAATTSANQTFGVLFDPRTTNAPRTSAGSVFFPPNGATMVAAPSCISLNIVNNQISCGILDSAKTTWAFAVPSP